MLESSLQIGRRYLNNYYLGSFDIQAGLFDLGAAYQTDGLHIWDVKRMKRDYF